MKEETERTTREQNWKDCPDTSTCVQTHNTIITAVTTVSCSEMTCFQHSRPERLSLQKQGKRKDAGSTNLQTINMTRTKTKVTSTWSNMELHRALHRTRCFEAALCTVTAPQYPHLKIGSNRGSVNCNLHPQHVVSHLSLSHSRPSTRTCGTNKQTHSFAIISKFRQKFTSTHINTQTSTYSPTRSKRHESLNLLKPLDLKNPHQSYSRLLQTIN